MKEKLITRIKVIEKNNGEKIYRPESYGFSLLTTSAKILFSPFLLVCSIIIRVWLLKRFWDYLYVDKDGFVQAESYPQDKIKGCKTLEEAKDIIDKHIVYVKKQEAIHLANKLKQNGNKIRKITFIKHP